LAAPQKFCRAAEMFLKCAKLNSTLFRAEQRNTSTEISLLFNPGHNARPTQKENIMSKTSTFTALVALTLGATCLQSTFVSAGTTLTSVTTSQMAKAMNAPAQQSTTITQTSSPTVSNNGSSTHTSSSMDSSRNSGSDVHSKSKYIVFTHIKHADTSVGDRIKNSFAAKGALRNPAATGGTVPQGPTGTIYGNGKNKGAKGVPGYDNVGNGPLVNLPGGNNSNGVKGVPGFENADNGPNVNLPGGKKKGSPDDAANFMAAQENADVAALLDSAAQGPNVNVPTQSSAPQEQADGLLNSIISFFGGGSSDSAAKTSPSAKSGETGAPANTTNTNGEGQGQSKATKEQHTVVDSEDMSSTSKDSAGNPYVTGGYIMHDVISGKTIGGSMVVIGPITVTKSKKTPNDADTSTPVNSSTSLSLNNPFSAHNQGGGTDNNVDQAGLGSGDIAVNSSYAQKDNGDGTNDAGENHTTSSDTLTSNSSLAKKNQGDGGDDRGARSAALAKEN
jgi:hypothetical protein